MAEIDVARREIEDARARIALYTDELFRRATPQHMKRQLRSKANDKRRVAQARMKTKAIGAKDTVQHNRKVQIALGSAGAIGVGLLAAFIRRRRNAEVVHEYDIPLGPSYGAQPDQARTSQTSYAQAPYATNPVGSTPYTESLGAAEYGEPASEGGIDAVGGSEYADVGGVARSPVGSPARATYRPYIPMDAHLPADGDGRSRMRWGRMAMGAATIGGLGALARRPKARELEHRIMQRGRELPSRISGKVRAARQHAHAASPDERIEPVAVSSTYVEPTAPGPVHRSATLTSPSVSAWDGRGPE